jgi:hypothetical protein
MNTTPNAPRKRGRPTKGQAPMTQAERSRQARDRRAREQAERTRALAACLRDLSVDPSDTAAGELIDALGHALIGTALDLYGAPGEPGPDAAFRCALRSLHGACADLLDDRTAGIGALRQAMNEIDA